MTASPINPNPRYGLYIYDDTPGGHMSGIQYQIHQDDGSGKCTTCETAWPTECEVEKNAVWVAEVER